MAACSKMARKKASRSVSAAWLSRSSRVRSTTSLSSTALASFNRSRMVSWASAKRWISHHGASTSTGASSSMRPMRALSLARRASGRPNWRAMRNEMAAPASNASKAMPARIRRLPRLVGRNSSSGANTPSQNFCSPADTGRNKLSQWRLSRTKLPMPSATAPLPFQVARPCSISFRPSSAGVLRTEALMASALAKRSSCGGANNLPSACNRAARPALPMVRLAVNADRSSRRTSWPIT